MDFFLLRHGETDWNLAGRLQGRADIPLNQKGRVQIGHAAEVLGRVYPAIDLIIASPLARARESAEIVADRLAYDKSDIIVEPLLVERCFGMGEGLTSLEREEKYPDGFYPGMELLEDLCKRAYRAFERIPALFPEKNSILLVAHGAILYALVTALTGGRIPYGSKMLTFESASIHRLQYAGGISKLEKYDRKQSLFMDIDCREVQLVRKCSRHCRKTVL